MAAIEVDGAGRDQKMLVDQIHQLVREPGREVGAEIDGAIFFQAAGDVDARKFFKRRVADVGIGLVVAQQHVEFRLVLLDEVVFERQRFFFVVDDDVIHVGNFADERAGFGVLPIGLEKVGAHAAAQRARLAHVEDRARRRPETGTPRAAGASWRLFREVPFQRVRLLDEEALSAASRRRQL